MALLQAIAAVVAVGLLLYLVFALLYPENLS
jgi:K+-transporting ATPase KdpF subunit